MADEQIGNWKKLETKDDSVLLYSYTPATFADGDHPAVDMKLWADAGKARDHVIGLEITLCGGFSRIYITEASGWPEGYAQDVKGTLALAEALLEMLAPISRLVQVKEKR